jgi:hypothetical protein
MNKNLKPEIVKKIENGITIIFRFGNVRLVSKRSYDGKLFWQIQEAVGAGYFIVWDGVFEDIENAMVTIEQTLHIVLVRDVVYDTVEEKA